MKIKTEIELYCPKGHLYSKDYFPNTGIMYCEACNENYSYSQKKNEAVVHQDIIWILADESFLDRVQCDRCEAIGLSIWNDGKIYCQSCRKIQDMEK